MTSPTPELAQLVGQFVDEAREYLQSLDRGLVQLESAPADAELLQELFRVVHSLKGMAGTMGYQAMVDLAHAMESVFDRLRSGAGEETASPELFDLLFEAAGALEAMVEQVSQGEVPEGDGLGQPGGLVEALRAAAAAGASSEGQSGRAVPGGGREGSAGSPNGKARPPLWFLDAQEMTALRQAVASGARAYAVEVAIDPTSAFKGPRAYAVLKALETVGQIVGTWPSREALEQERFEDRFVVALVSDQPPQAVQTAALNVVEVRSADVTPVDVEDRAPSSGEAAPKAVPSRRDTSGRGVADATVRVETSRLDALVDLVGELVITSNQIQDRHQRRLMPDDGQIAKLGRVTSELQSAVMRLRMVPLRQVFTRFPRAVRDLARRSGKQVRLVIQGEETELDRHIVNEIGEPLLHLIRNAVDHGIEPPEERERVGKPRTGLVKLSARHEGSHVVIELEDDGRGIDVERIRRKAVERGRLSAEEAEHATAERLLQLIFEPGFSTAERVTEVSGRGVGMDAAKAAVEALGGRLAVHTRAGRGTLCIVRLPLTLAIIQALLVETDGQIFALPAEAIQSIERVDPSGIETVHGRRVLRYRDGIVPLVSLKVRLGFAVDEARTDSLAVVIATGRRQAAIAVDRVVGLQDLVIRTLSSYLKVPGVAGAAILGSGRIALILDPSWLA